MKKTGIFLVVTYLFLSGCSRNSGVSVVIGQPDQIGPIDPPYLPSVVYPSGLHLDLVADASLTHTYPSSANNPFGGAKEHHYLPVRYFIDLSRASLSERVSDHFRLSEYANPTVQRGDNRAYIDAQIVLHVQRMRSGLGRPLILNSGFRSPAHNQSVGGAAFSRHIYGDAVDIDVDQNRADAHVQAQEVFNEAQDVGVDFVQPLIETSVTVNGTARVSWVHIDDRGF